ncbi:helix-turn-helix transcriptional regulator [Halalkalibacter sp. APA_J-10(15)]|uniref:helix-turn-helix transcriptional regulator n=1 Tax=Halalkalibacter sp. APA_J-10(15) TaxID=2933805 RepID=UPI001FF2A7A8|nr:AraC family transcriptional regulator [Halalkalibacter sp. APA_J-10(15)]MCK0471075.1 helix-turn-helix domain-containing protein [Halalkalibacter sp. APA_J-10(15)]
MNHYTISKQIIAFIENNLHERLSLESIAKHAGFSKYHFHRLFYKEIGQSVMDYVRSRRLANAAHLLLQSDEKIIDIAFYFRFESQESFTRSFKKAYHLPPGQYRKLMSKLKLQKKENTSMEPQKIKGWFLSGSHPFHFKIDIDEEVFHQGRRSATLKSISTESEHEFATIMQQVKADHYRNKRLKFSGFLKAKDIEGFCGFWMRVDSTYGDILQFDNMADRPITTDCDWNHHSIVLDVPQDSGIISFGALLSGKGQLWMDSLSLSIVDNRTPTTNIDYTSQVNHEPINLSFEE